MPILMIRHSDAAEPGSVLGGDSERPLTERALIDRGIFSNDIGEPRAIEKFQWQVRFSIRSR